MSKMTPARKRTLEAVQAGKCHRYYTREGNTLHGPKGVSAKMLWQLAREKLIGDDPKDGGNRCRLALTKAGAAALIADQGHGS